jgi:hypothetical protein
VEFFGDVPADEIEAVNNEFCGDPRFDTVRSSLWDMSRITTLNVTIGDIEYAAAVDKGASEIKPTLKGAIVAPAGPIRELVEQYLSISSKLDTSWDTRLFDNLELAKQWIVT